MSVDLSDLLDSLRREINPPGTDLYPDTNDGELTGHLQDALWEAYLDGFLQSYTETDGIVTNRLTGGPDMPRDLQQLVVFYAGFRITRNAIRALKTRVSNKAGPVSQETEQSANLLRDVFKDLFTRRDILLRRLSDLGVIPTFYYDALVERSYGYWQHDISWER